MANSAVIEEDKYRTYMHGEGERNTKWRLGAPPSYEAINKLFEEGRTKIWPPGSLGEKVQNFVKTWEMELFHKISPDDFKTLNPQKFTVSVNGRKALNLEEIKKLGGYNNFLQTSLPEELRGYNPAEVTAEGSQAAFTTAFPRGFALEVVEVYSGPPSIVYKFRHWGYMEGPFLGHAPTGQLVQFFGIATFEVDEEMKVSKVGFFYDRGELLAGLMKGAKLADTDQQVTLSCPFLSNTG